MKRSIFLLMFILLLSSVYAVNELWMSSNDANTLNKNNPIVSGAVLSNVTTTNTISSCKMVYQPVARDIDEDGTTDIIVFCNQKIKIYDYTATLQAELITGTLKGSPAIAIKDDLSYNIVAVVNNSQNEGNLTYYDFNGTTITINQTYNASTVGGGTAAFCPVANNVCKANQEAVLEADFSGDSYYCRYRNDVGTIVCFENSDLTGTAFLNVTPGLSCEMEHKIYIVDWNGGDDEILFSCGKSGSPYTHTFKYYDSTGTEIWSKANNDFNYFSSFIDNDNNAICTFSKSSGGSSPNSIICYPHNGSTIRSISFDANTFDEATTDGVQYNTVNADFNNDGFKDVFTHFGIYDYQNSVFLVDYDANDIYNTEVIDLNGDGSLDYIKNTGSEINLILSTYTNQDPIITELAYNTGNPVCLYSSITFTVGFEDTEEEWGRIRVDRYGDGNYSSFGSYAGSPVKSISYNKLGTYTTLIELEDQSGNKDNITYGVIVQTSNCYTSGQGGSTTTEATTGAETNIGGFIIKDGSKDGYTPNNALYNSNNSIYFDADTCETLYGANWRRMVIPCPLRLLVKQGLTEIQGWVIGSFILVILGLIVFVMYIIIKHRK